MQESGSELIAVVGNVYICDFRGAGTQSFPLESNGAERIAALNRSLEVLRNVCAELSAANARLLQETGQNAIDLAGTIDVIATLIAHVTHAADEHAGNPGSPESLSLLTDLDGAVRICAELHAGIHDVSYRSRMLSRACVDGRAVLRDRVAGVRGRYRRRPAPGEFPEPW